MTTISDYLKETEYASTKLLEAIWDNFNKAEQLKTEIKDKSQIVQQEYSRAISMQIFAEDPDDVMAGVGRYWENYFGADKEVYLKNEKLTKLTKQLTARELSLTLLCGNLLEHAKKGISFIYGHPTSWPTGRAVGTQSLEKIIIEARNQSIHIDEAIKSGSYKNAGIANCFKKLELEIDATFGSYLTRDLSFEIIKALNWTSYDYYKKDIETIK